MICKFCKFVLKWHLRKYPLIRNVSETHIRRCRSCKNLAETYVATDRALRDSVATEKERRSNPKQYENIMQAVKTEHARRNTEQEGRHVFSLRFRLQLVGIGAVSAIVLSLFVAFITARTDEENPAPKAQVSQDTSAGGPAAFTVNLQPFNAPLEYATTPEAELSEEARSLMTDFRLLYDHFATLPGSALLFRPISPQNVKMSKDRLEEG